MDKLGSYLKEYQEKHDMKLFLMGDKLQHMSSRNSESNNLLHKSNLNISQLFVEDPKTIQYECEIMLKGN